MFIELRHGLYDLSKIRRIELLKKEEEGFYFKLVFCWDVNEKSFIHYKIEQECLDDYKKIKNGLNLL